jgi:hypothetical protein
MNKRPDDPSKYGEVVTIDAPQLPAVIKKTKNPWKKFTVFDRLAEQIRDRYQDLGRLRSEIEQRKPGQIMGNLEHFLVDDEDREKLARCRELIEQLDAPENYEPADDDTDYEEPILKKSVISLRLAGTMAAVHIGGQKEGEQEAFAKILLAHVYDANVSRIVLEATCREIERTKKYMQSTSEVLEVLTEQRREWWKRRCAIDGIERLSETVQQQILEAQQKCELEKANEAVTHAGQKVRERVFYLKRVMQEAATAKEAAQQAQQKVELQEKNLNEAIKTMRAAEAERDKIEAKFEAERQAEVDAKAKCKIEAKYRGTMKKATNGDARSD